MTDEQQITTPTIPHSREAEEAVLGAVLINPDAYFDVAHFLHADDFYIHRNGWIWEALRTCRKSMSHWTCSPSPKSWTAKVSSRKSVDRRYLTALINQTPNSLNAESYGHIVSEHAARRRMIQAANQIAALAFNEQAEIEAGHFRSNPSFGVCGRAFHRRHFATALEITHGSV